jgi:cell shape-determining protein MreC
MLVALQTVLIFVVAWTLMRPAAATSTGAEAVYQGVIKSLIETSDPAGTPPVSQQRLETLLRDQQAVQTLRTQNQLLTAAGDATLREVRDLAAQLENNETQLQQARALNRDLDARVQSLERAQAQAESAAQDTSGAVSATWGWVGGWSGWASYGLIGGLGAALGAAAAGWWFTSRVAPGLLDDEKG